VIIQEKLVARPVSKWKPVIARYWTLCKLSFQERMEYRWGTLIFMAMTLLPALIGIYLWGVVFNSKNDPVALRSITTYYVVAAFIGFRVPQFHWEMMFQIREGRLANALMRPMSYPATLFWYEAGGRTWSTILTAPFFVVLAILLGDTFQTPTNPFTWLLVLVAFLISFALSFFITAGLGLITVWQNQPESFFALYSTGSQWLGGVFVPLTFLPWGIGDWLQWLPFAYIYSLPVRIFQGLPADKIWQGFAVQLLWLALSAVFFKWIWRKATRRYEVFEG
jgi:ABC-2 type transport system permease protein